MEEIKAQFEKYKYIFLDFTDLSLKYEDTLQNKTIQKALLNSKNNSTKYLEMYQDLFTEFMFLMNKHASTLHSLRIKESLSLAKEKGAQIGAKPKKTKAQLILGLWNDGFKALEIAKQLGVSESCARYHLKKQGVEFNYTKY